jgi:tripartite-type tricarboxylate transporter receptor subunit TctC
VVTEYKPGASGLLGAKQVISSPADGYTLMLASTGAILSVAASQGAKPDSYNVTRELAPISLVAAPSYILVVNPSVPVKTAADIISYAKPIRGSCPSVLPAPAPPRISPAHCLRRWLGSISCTCPTAAPARR